VLAILAVTAALAAGSDVHVIHGVSALVAGISICE
jgi:hypothetical protein